MALLTSAANQPAVSKQPKLTTILSVASPSGAVIPGAGQEVLRFSLAAQGADFTVKQITFNKQGTCSSAGTGEAAIYDVADLTNPHATLPAGRAWFNLNSFYFNNFSRPLVIASGSSKTLVLKGDTTGCTGRG